MTLQDIIDRIQAVLDDACEDDWEAMLRRLRLDLEIQQRRERDATHG
jgi:hypothetical protein